MEKASLRKLKVKSLDSCFRRNDNVAVAAAAKQNPPGEIRGEIY